MAVKRIISLLGCGWLGFPLAKSLISKGFRIKASTTSVLKLEVLEQEGIDPYLVQYSSELPLPDLTGLLEADILIITIPPARRDPNGFANYQKMIESVCMHLEHSQLSKVILCSSTSVYADSNQVLDEFSPIFPETESGSLMAEAEGHLLHQKIPVVCLRLAGLIGPDRMPGKFFAGKSFIPNGLSPVNLIHLNDVIGIIENVIRKGETKGIFNCCAPSHPTRKEFYTLAAERESLKKPDFVAEKKSWKIVTSARLKSELDYDFKFPSLIDWVRSVE